MDGWIAGWMDGWKIKGERRIWTNSRIHHRSVMVESSGIDPSHKAPNVCDRPPSFAGSTWDRSFFFLFFFFLFPGFFFFFLFFIFFRWNISSSRNNNNNFNKKNRRFSTSFPSGTKQMSQHHLINQLIWLIALLISICKADLCRELIERVVCVSLTNRIWFVY